MPSIFTRLYEAVFGTEEVPVAITTAPTATAVTATESYPGYNTLGYTASNSTSRYTLSPIANEVRRQQEREDYQRQYEAYQRHLQEHEAAIRERYRQQTLYGFGELRFRTLEELQRMYSPGSSSTLTGHVMGGMQGQPAFDKPKKIKRNLPDWW